MLEGHHLLSGQIGLMLEKFYPANSSVVDLSHQSHRTNVRSSVHLAEVLAINHLVYFNKMNLKLHYLERKLTSKMKKISVSNRQ